jgi:hypothetical protein
MPGTYAQPMDTIRTGRTPHEIVETGQPESCANGHPLAGNVIVGYGSHPDGGRARCYTCKVCGETWWDEPTTP